MRKPGEFVLATLMDVSSWMMTQNGLRYWDDFWMAIYQWSAGSHYTRYPEEWGDPTADPSQDTDKGAT
jgi:hypothetical protein